MERLNELENAVLQAMCKRFPSDASALEAQIKRVIVQKRDNTGVGFYSKLEVKGPVDQINEKVMSNIFATIAGLKNPVAFVLFLRNGLVDILEGATTEDSTVDINFSDVRFEILPNT